MTSEEKEISKRVYERYPKTEKEFSCWQEKLRIQNLRELYKVRLKSEIEQSEISGIAFKQDELL